jgi:hypothetical protein
LPIWGFYYKILLKRPLTETQWRAKIDSVNLGLDQDSEERRLFTDLTGYLERWPEGEKAGDYLGKAMFTALVAHEQSKNPGREEERRFLEEDATLLHLALSAPKSTGHAGYNMYGYEENLPLVKAEYQELTRILGRGEGK